MTSLGQIRELEQRLLHAMLQSDVKELDTLIADELIFTDHTGQIISKQADLDAHRSGKLSIETIKPSEERIKIYTDTAVVNVLMEITGKYAEQAFQGKIRYSRVWLKFENSWKVVAGHATSVNS